jgi:peptidyl-prolyl cis-trans isomerase A (cyclophilin A)
VRRTTLIALALAFVCAALAGCGGSSASSGSSQSGPPDALLQPAKLKTKSPQLYTVAFETTKGEFVVDVHRSWAPRAAERFYNLVKSHFYDGARFFRVVPKFVVQFGISPYPQVSTAWQNATIPDDPVIVHNTRGTVAFASAGPNSRTTQVFINLADNSALDQTGFAPFGAVVSGMDVVDKLYSGYGDTPTTKQGEMEQQGNAWLDKTYPKLDSIKTARVTQESNPALP